MFMSIALIPTCTFHAFVDVGFCLLLICYDLFDHIHCVSIVPSSVPLPFFPITHLVILFFSPYIPRTLHLISPFFFLSVISPISRIHTYFFFNISLFLSTLPSILHSFFYFLLYSFIHLLNCPPLKNWLSLLGSILV